MIRKWLLSGLVFVCLFVACVAPTRVRSATYTTAAPNPALVGEVYPVYIDQEFTAAEKAAIAAALVEWNTALNGARTYVVASDQFQMEQSVISQVMTTGQGLLILRNKRTDYDHAGDEMDGVLAFVPGLGVPFVHVIDDAIGTRNLKAIVAHEIGHTLGIPHVPLTGSLMNPSYPFGLDCVDKETLQALSFASPKFDWHYMRYCQE